MQDIQFIFDKERKTIFKTLKGKIQKYEGIAQGDGLANNKFDVVSVKTDVMPADIEFKKSLFKVLLPMKKQ